jgi:hypothetical protein
VDVSRENKIKTHGVSEGEVPLSLNILICYSIIYWEREIIKKIPTIRPNKMLMLQSLFYLTTALHVSGVTITHLQEHKTTVTTASGNHYTVIDRVKFTDKGYR